MKFTLYIIVALFTIQSITSCCKEKVTVCDPGKISLGTFCVPEENFTFYIGKPNFHCFNDSILIGVNTDAKLLLPYYLTYNNKTASIFVNYALKIEYGLPAEYYGFFNECSINGKSEVSWLIINDTAQFNNYPESIKVTMLVKESDNFKSKTLETKEIVLNKR